MGNAPASSRPGVRIRLTVSPFDLPREVHDEAHRIISACYLEAGYVVEQRWSQASNRYVNDTPVPDDVRHLAAKIAADHLGIPYEIVTDEELADA